MPWSTTFLRPLLARELQDASEILVLSDLLADPDRRFPVTPLDFFYGEPAYRLYQPLCVRPLDSDERNLESRYFARSDATSVFDLAGLLQVLRDDPRGARSVLLEARSGAGKTVACRAAMFDCLFGQEPSGPRLGGLIPCPLLSFEADGEILKCLDNPDRPATPRVIWESLARATNLSPSGGSALVQQWLTVGPPLLLLVDLNRFSTSLRRIVAQGLVEFLQWSDRRQLGHRAVVTYRGQALDDTLRLLQTATWDEGSRGQKVFVRADLAALPHPASFLYLKNLRTVQATLTGAEHDEERLSETVEREVDALRELVRRFDRGEGSLVSTPLLLYFVGRLGGARLRSARSVAELYDWVVNDFLEREEHLATNLKQHFDPRSIRLAMGRVALVILAHGPETTRLTGDAAANINLNDLFQNAPIGLTALLPDRTLRAIDPFWHSSPYVKESLDSPFLKAQSGRGLSERSLLRRTGNAIGFLHDSFLYYFAAYVVRYWNDPDPQYLQNTDDDPWRAATVRWWASDPARWKEVAEFLGGMLPGDAMLRLVAPFLVARPNAALPELVHRLVLGRRRDGGATEVVSVELERATRRPELSRWPFCLLNLVMNWLADAGAAALECERFVTTNLKPLVNSRDAERPLVLESIPPARRPTFLDHHSHRTAVELIEVLPDGRVVSVDVHDHLVLWDPDTGQTTRFPEPVAENHPWWGWRTTHPKQVIVVSNEQFIYVDSRGKAIHYRLPGRSSRNEVDASPVEGLDPPTSWLQRPDGRLLVRDGQGTVFEVALDPTGRLRGRTFLFENRGASKSAGGQFGALADGALYLWGADGLVVWEAEAGRELLRKDFHPWKVTHTARLADGRLVAGTKEGEVLVCNPSRAAAPEHVYSHGERIVDLKPTAAGWVISASRERSSLVRKDLHVLAWRPGLSQPVALGAERERDTRFHVFSDGRVLITAGSELTLLDGASLSIESEHSNILEYAQFLEPLLDDVRFALAGPNGVTTYDVSTGTQRWLLSFPPLAGFHPSVVRADPRGNVFIGCHDGRLIAMNVGTPLAETRTWFEIMKHAEEEPQALGENTESLQVTSLFESELWSIYGTTTGEVGVRDLRTEPGAAADASTGPPLEKLDTGHPQHENPVVAVGTLPDGRLFSVSSGSPNRLVVVNPSTGDVEATDSAPDLPELKNPGIFRVLANGHILIATEDRRRPLISWDPVSKRIHTLVPGCETHQLTHLELLNGRRYISAGDDGQVIQWDTSTVPPTHKRLYQHRSSIDHLVVTSSGEILSADDQDVRHWVAGQGVAVVEPAVDRLDCLCEVAGERVLYGGKSCLLVGSLASKEVNVIDRPSDAICSRALLSSGAVAYGDAAGRVNVWTPPKPLVQHCPEPRVVGVARLGRDHLALLHADGRLSAWHPDRSRSEPGPIIEGDIVAFQECPDAGATVALADGRILTWPRGNASLQKRSPLPGPVVGLECLSDGRVVCLGVDGSLIDLGDGRTLLQHSRTVVAAETLADGRLVFADDAGRCFVRERDDTREIGAKELACRVTALGVLTDPLSTPVVACSDGMLYRQGKSAQDWVAFFKCPAIATRLVAVGPHKLAVLDVEGRVVVVDHRDGRILREYEAESGTVTSLAAYPDGRLILGCQDGSLLVESRPGALLRRRSRHSHAVTHLAVLPSRRLVSVDAAGDFGGSGPKGDEVDTKWSSGLAVTSLSCFSDGRIVFGDERGNVRAMHFVPEQSAREFPAWHRGAVSQLASLHDGRLVSLGHDDCVRVSPAPAALGSSALTRIDLDSLSLVQELVPLPNNQLLIVKSSESYLWNASTGHLHPVPNDRRITCATPDPILRFEETGSLSTDMWTATTARVVVGDHEGVVALWDLSSGHHEILHREHRSEVKAIAVQPNGIVISGDEQGTILVHDRTRRTTRTWRQFDRRITHLVIVGDFLVIGIGHSLKLFLAQADDGGPREIVAEREDPMTCLTALDDPPSILMADYHGKLRRWDLGTLELADVWNPPTEEFFPSSFVRVLPGRRALLVDSSGNAYLVDLETGTSRSLFLEPYLQHLAVVDDGRVVFQGFNRVLVWDPDGGATPEVLQPENGEYVALAVRPDGKILLARDDGVVVERGPAGGPVREVFRRTPRVEGLKLGPDGTKVLINVGQVLLTWDPERDRLERSALPGPFRCARRLLDGRIAFGLRNGIISVHAGTGEPGEPLPAQWDDHDGEVVDLVDLGGGRLASLDSTGNLIVRVLNQPDDVATVHQHDQKVTCLLALPDGWFASASDDRTIAVCHPETNRRTVLPVYQPIRELRLSRRGSPSRAFLLAVLERGPVLAIALDLGAQSADAAS